MHNSKWFQLTMQCFGWKQSIKAMHAGPRHVLQGMLDPSPVDRMSCLSCAVVPEIITVFKGLQVQGTDRDMLLAMPHKVV